MSHEGIPSPIPDRHTAAIEELAMHVKGLAGDLKVEREAREKVEKDGISILNLRVPFLMVFLIIGPLVTAGIYGGTKIHQINDHMGDTQIHADRNQTLAKDGIAYTKDVKDLMGASESARAASDREAARLMLKERPLVCGPPRGKAHTQECKFGDQPAAWSR